MESPNPGAAVAQRLGSTAGTRRKEFRLDPNISLVLGKCPHADPPLSRATFFADHPPSTQACGQIRANKYRTVSRAFYGIYSSSNCKECNPILLYHFIHSGFIPLSRYLSCSCAI